MLLTVVFSNHCNKDCSYCCITNKDTSPVLTLDEVISFIDKNYVKDDTMVEFFGGEPTLHWKELCAIIDYCNNKYPDITFRIFSNMQYELTDQHIEYFGKISEINASVDGSYELNVGRKDTPEEYKLITDNIKLLAKLYPESLAVACVVAMPKQYKSLPDTLELFKSWGVRYTSLEVAMTWKDDKVIGMKTNGLKMLATAILDVIEESSKGYLRHVCFPRDLLTSDFWFKDQKEKSCTDSVRALSPRGNIYCCRDWAANEEGLIKKEQQPDKDVYVINLDDPIPELVNSYSIKDNNFDHMKKYDEATPCPVKSAVYERFGGLDNMWWYEDKYQKDIIQPIYRMQQANLQYIKMSMQEDPRAKELGKTLEHLCLAMRRMVEEVFNDNN